MPSIELIAVAFTLVAVYLTIRQNIWCWPLGMVSVTLYAVTFYEPRLYALMGLQGIYFALSAYGWWAWLRGGEDHGELRVSMTSNRTRGVLVTVAVFAGIALGQALDRFTDASLPLLDAILASSSVVAQWMQARKLLESWLVWLVVDVFYIGMFIYTGLYPTAALYAVFLFLALKGFLEWRRSMRRAVMPTEAAAIP